jgi:hypothetical protein
METIFLSIKKYGVTGVLVAWLWYTDNRLSKVEQQLWDCYKSNNASIFDGSFKANDGGLFAILPNKRKIIYNNQILEI